MNHTHEQFSWMESFHEQSLMNQPRPIMNYVSWVWLLRVMNMVMNEFICTHIHRIHSRVVFVHECCWLMKVHEFWFMTMVGSWAWFMCGSHKPCKIHESLFITPHTYMSLHEDFYTKLLFFLESTVRISYNRVPLSYYKLLFSPTPLISSSTDVQVLHGPGAAT